MIPLNTQIHDRSLSWLCTGTSIKCEPHRWCTDYWTRLTYAIELALQVNENIIITGDLNSNLLCSNNNKFIDLVNIFNLKNVIDKPTRISGNTSTLLDPIILSDILNCNYSDVLKIPRHIDRKSVV